MEAEILRFAQDDRQAKAHRQSSLQMSEPGKVPVRPEHACVFFPLSVFREEKYFVYSFQNSFSDTLTRYYSLW